MDASLLGGSGMHTPERLYYYVQAAQSCWTLALVDEPAWVSPIGYLTQDEAVAAAIELAQQDWQARGHPTGVRIRLSADAGWDERIFGGDPAPPTGVVT